MSQCQFCQGTIDPETQRCRLCGRTPVESVPSSAGRISKASASYKSPILPGSGPEHPEASRTSAPRRMSLSRRTLLLGLAGIAVGGTVLGRLVYVLAHEHPLYTYRGHTQWVESLAWSPSGQRIVSGSDDGTAQVWDALTGAHRLTYPDPVGIEVVAWSPDGHWIVSGSWDGTATVWEATTGKQVIIYRGHRSNQSLFSYHSNPLFELLPAARGSHPFTAPQLPSSARIPGVDGLEWSPDGRRIASTGGDGTAQVWEALTGKTLLTLGSVQQALSRAVWSPDGQRLATGAYGVVSIWDIPTGTLLLTYRGHADWVNALAWSPDGRLLASASGQSIQIWKPDTGQQVVTYTGHSDFVTVVTWSPEGRYVASAGFDLTVRVWEATTGQTSYVYRGHMGWFHSFFSDHSPDPTVLARQTGELSPTALNRTQFEAAGHLAPLLPLDGPPRDQVTTVAWSPAGTYIASGGSDQTIQVWVPG